MKGSFHVSHAMIFLFTVSFLVLLPSCFYFQPPSAVVERNYESDSITRRVKIGRDFNLWPPLQETPEHARERLLSSISQECPRYRILAEGIETGSHVESYPQMNVTTGQQEMTAHSVTDRYLWIRYRCE